MPQLDAIPEPDAPAALPRVHEVLRVRHPTEEDLGQLYHLNTRLHDSEGPLLAVARRRRLPGPVRSRYVARAGADPVRLAGAGGGLGRVAAVLAAGAAAAAWPRSGAVEAYLLGERVDGLARGVYHHRPETRVLEPVALRPVADALARALARPSTAEAAVVLTQRWGNAQALAGARGYRHVLLQAGAALEAMRAEAARLGWTARLEDALDETLETLVGADGVDESFLGILVLGEREAQT